MKTEKTGVVLHNINYNKPQSVDEHELVEMLKNPSAVEGYNPHLNAFFLECPEHLITQFVQEQENLTFDDLHHSYETALKPILPIPEDKEKWLLMKYNNIK